MARISKWTHELECTILHVLETGGTRKAAYEAGEIDSETFARWLKSRPGFGPRVAKAELIGKSREPVVGERPTYSLTPISPGNMCSRYDGIPDGLFVFHEALSFAEDRQYDRTAICARAHSVIDRALGKDGGSERFGRSYENLPEFSRAGSLEIIVRILPKF